MELEEAIQNVKDEINVDKNNLPIAEANEYEEERTLMLNRIEAKETVLNHLKQKEHELSYQKNYCTMVTESKDDIIKTMAERMSKQEKMIELMAEHIKTGCDFDNRIQNISQIKQYFEKKAEE